MNYSWWKLFQTSLFWSLTMDFWLGPARSSLEIIGQDVSLNTFLFWYEGVGSCPWVVCIPRHLVSNANKKLKIKDQTFWAVIVRCLNLYTSLLRYLHTYILYYLYRCQKFWYFHGHQGNRRSLEQKRTRSLEKLDVCKSFKNLSSKYKSL